MAIPIRIVFDNFTKIGGLLSVFLIPNFETSYPSDLLGFKRDVVFILGLFIRIFYHHIDGLPDIAFLKVDIPYKIGILEDLGGLEVVGKDLM